MKYVWNVDDAKIAAEVTGLGRISIWVNGARIRRSYVFAFSAEPLRFNLPNGREVALKPTRVLVVNGQELEPLEPFTAQCDVCASPMTANETSCGDCGHTQPSHRERREHTSSLRRARRPLTLLSLFYLVFAINNFVKLCREDATAESSVAVAEGNLVEADAADIAAAREIRSDAHAGRVVSWTFCATIMGLLALLSRRWPLVGLSLGLALFAYVTFNVVVSQGGLSLGVTFISWLFIYFFVRGFEEARALRARASP